MKRAATDHPKLANLADAIAAEHKHQRRFAVLIATGILERLWHFTAKFAPCGDIGKRRDEEIARWLGWPIDDSSTLIRLLIQTEWLVNHPVHRLIVNDWSEHADDTLKRLLQRKGLAFVCPDISGQKPSARASASSQSHIDDGERCRNGSHAPKREARPARPLPDIEPVIARMVSLHPKKNRLGGNLLAQAVCGKVAESTDPEATLQRIEKRHLSACRSDWAGREAKFVPDLVRWVEQDGWMDPEAAAPVEFDPYALAEAEQKLYDQELDEFGRDEADARRTARARARR